MEKRKPHWNSKNRTVKAGGNLVVSHILKPFLSQTCALFCSAWIISWVEEGTIIIAEHCPQSILDLTFSNSYLSNLTVQPNKVQPHSPTPLCFVHLNVSLGLTKCLKLEQRWGCSTSLHHSFISTFVAKTIRLFLC